MDIKTIPLTWLETNLQATLNEWRTPASQSS